MSGHGQLPDAIAFGEELREVLQTMFADAGTSVDSGGLLTVDGGERDLWVRVGGREFHINVRLSLGELSKARPFA